MPKRLDSAYSVTVDMDDERSVFQGHLRIVRSARRARALRKRGVEVDCYNNPLGLGNGPTRFWTWYETEASYNSRAETARAKRLLRRAVREAMATGGLDWVDALLQRTHGPDPLKHDPATFVARWGSLTPDEYFEAGVRNMSPDCWPLEYNPEVELE